MGAIDTLTESLAMYAEWASVTRSKIIDWDFAVDDDMFDTAINLSLNHDIAVEYLKGLDKTSDDYVGELKRLAKMQFMIVNVQAELDEAYDMVVTGLRAEATSFSDIRITNNKKLRQETERLKKYLARLKTARSYSIPGMEFTVLEDEVLDIPEGRILTEEVQSDLEHLAETLEKTKEKSTRTPGYSAEDLYSHFESNLKKAEENYDENKPHSYFFEEPLRTARTCLDRLQKAIDEAENLDPRVRIFMMQLNPYKGIVRLEDPETGDVYSPGIKVDPGKVKKLEELEQKYEQAFTDK